MRLYNREVKISLRRVRERQLNIAVVFVKPMIHGPMVANDMLDTTKSEDV